MASRKVNVMSSDGVTFEVDEIVALEWQVIKHMIKDDFADGAITLPKVTSRILSKVIEYCKKHVESSKSEDRSADDNLKAWDAEFVNVDVDTLFHLMMAANYLNIQSLLELICQRVADIMKGKSVEDIRETFNINNDYTPEEEEEIRREFPWAFK